MSLDALRKVHAQTVDSLMMELARITQALRQREDEARTLERRIDSQVTSYRRRTEEGLPIEALLDLHASLDALQAALTEAREGIAAVTAAWNEMQARLVAASQERAILDRFAERRDQARRAEGNHREQLALDEAGQRRHALLDKRP